MLSISPREARLLNTGKMILWSEAAFGWWLTDVLEQNGTSNLDPPMKRRLRVNAVADDDRNERRRSWEKEDDSGLLDSWEVVCSAEEGVCGCGSGKPVRKCGCEDAMRGKTLPTKDTWTTCEEIHSLMMNGTLGPRGELHRLVECIVRPQRDAQPLPLESDMTCRDAPGEKNCPDETMLLKSLLKCRYWSPRFLGECNSFAVVHVYKPCLRACCRDANLSFENTYWCGLYRWPSQCCYLPDPAMNATRAALKRVQDLQDGVKDLARKTLALRNDLKGLEVRIEKAAVGSRRVFSDLRDIRQLDVLLELLEGRSSALLQLNWPFKLARPCCDQSANFIV